VETDEGDAGEGVRGVGLLRSGGGGGEYRDGVGALLLSDLSLSEGGRVRGGENEKMVGQGEEGGGSRGVVVEEVLPAPPHVFRDLLLQMHTHAHTHTYTHMHAHTNAHTRAHVHKIPHTHICTHTRTCTHTHTLTHTHTRTCGVCLYVCVCVYLCLCVYVCV
jgi:hypothetical protein